MRTDAQFAKAPSPSRHSASVNRGSEIENSLVDLGRSLRQRLTDRSKVEGEHKQTGIRIPGKQQSGGIAAMTETIDLVLGQFRALRNQITARCSGNAQRIQRRQASHQSGRLRDRRNPPRRGRNRRGYRAPRQPSTGSKDRFDRIELAWSWSTTFKSRRSG